jgi:hypothetical protein
MLSTLYAKESQNKKQCCEDSVWVKETNTYIVGCVADGCSTGISSVFAARALTYLWAKYADIVDEIHNFKMLNVIEDLESLAELMGIFSLNLLSTFIPFCYNKISKTLRIRPFGDGFYRINDTDYVLEQNNTPDYIGRQVDEGFAGRSMYLDKYPEIVYNDVNSFIISSDGIESLQENQFNPFKSDQTPKEFLLSKPNSENCLQLRYNILRNKKVNNADDLGIVSYIND